MTDLEQIAKAAWDAQRENGYEVFERWDKLNDKGRAVVIDRVRFVLQALAEPSEAMIEAGSRFIVGPVEYKNPVRKLDGNSTAWGAWRAMIKSILDQEQGHD